MNKRLAFAAALLTVVLLLGFLGWADTTVVTAHPPLPLKRFLPIMMKRSGVTPLQITQALVEPADRPPALGDTMTVRVRIANVGPKTITQLPAELFFDDQFIEFDDASPYPTTVLPGHLLWQDLTAGIPLAIGGDLVPGGALEFDLSFRVIRCPTMVDPPIRIEVAGAVDEDGQVVETAANTTGFDIVCPQLTVTKRVATPESGIARLRDPVTFMIVLQNTGNQVISQLPLQDTFDSNFLSYVSASPQPDSVAAGTLTWNNLVDGTPLAPGDRVTVMVTMQAIGCPDQQRVENAATVTGALVLHGGATYPVPDATASAKVDIPCADLRVEKRIVSPDGGTAQPGDLVTYEIILENIGNKPIAVLPLDDIFDGQILEFVSADPDPVIVIENLAQWDDLTGPAPNGFDRDLAPGESFTVTATFRVVGCPYNQRALNEARVSNAIAIHEGEEWAVPQVSSSVSLTVETGADVCPALTMTKVLVEPASGVLQPGDLVTFRIAITNVGTQPIVTLPLDDIFDMRYLEFVNASLPPDAAVPGLLRWDDLTSRGATGFGRDLLTGESFELTATFRAVGCPPEQETRNLARVHGVAVIRNNVPETYLGSITRVAGVRIACPAVEVTKHLASSLDCSVAGIGDELTFDIEVTNTGNTTLNSITLVDIYETDYLEFVSATPAPDSLAPAGTLTWDNLVAGLPLAPGESTVVTVNFTALASTQSIYPPVTRNVADVFGVDEYGYATPDTDASEVSIGVADADLFIEQSGPSETHPGDTITYQVRYGNNGPDSATYVRVLDIIPEGTVFVGDTLCGNVNTGCFLGTLPAGWSDTFEVQVYVPFDITPETVLQNAVSIQSGQTPGGAVCGIGDHDQSNNVVGASSTVLADFGRMDDPGTYSADSTHEWLGEVVLSELGAPDGEAENDGWLSAMSWYRSGRIVQLDLLLSTAGEGAERYGLAPDKRIYVRGWLDRNRDGVFAADELILAWNGGPGIVGQWEYPDKLDGQWPLDQRTFKLVSQITAPMPPRGDPNYYTWVRFRIGYGAPPSPHGFEPYGEIEDYWVGFLSRDP